MFDQIELMLTEAYCHLGVSNGPDLDKRIREARDYLEKDRERYIEVVEPDVPEYLITTECGVICRLIPLAQSVSTDVREKVTVQKTTVLSLMVTDQTSRYVLAHTTNKLSDNPLECGYGYPVHRYASAKEITTDLTVLSPQEITPAATPMEREIFGMIFMAIAKFSNHLPINSIPHKTERAMLMAKYTPNTELTVDGQTVCGKLILLASEDSMWEEQREDHSYSYSRELCLLVGEGQPRYLLQTRHVYNYFRKVVYDNVPGGTAYEPTEKKQEVICQYVALEDIPFRLYPHYF